MTDQAAYFLRQFYVNNFIMCLGSSHTEPTSENTFIYTLTEMGGNKFSSEIASCVCHRLRYYAFLRRKSECHKIICWWCWWTEQEHHHDNCSVELVYNISTNVLCSPWLLVHASRLGIWCNKEKVRTGHSPWAILKNLQWIWNFNLGLDFSVEEWKVATRSTMKTGDWHFKFAICKRFILTREKQGVV